MQDQRIVSVFRVSDGNSVKLEYRDTLPSTAVLAREYAKAGYPDRYIIFTDKQMESHITDVKPKDGEYEQGLFMSCILRPSIFPSQAGLVAPLAAVALATGLEEHTVKKMGIGWVSDIYCDGARIGGCAVEGKLDDSTSYEYMIVTFAVKLDKRNFPPRLTDMVRQVFEAENQSVAMIIAKTVLNKFFAIYKDIKTPNKYMEIYRSKFVLSGVKIKYQIGEHKRICRVIGVDKASCALIVETREGESLKITSPFGVTIPRRLRKDATSNIRYKKR